MFSIMGKTTQLLFLTTILLISSIAITLSIFRAFNVRSVEPSTSNDTAIYSNEVVVDEECLKEYPDNKIPGRVGATFKVGTTNDRIYQIADQLGANHVQPLSGKIADFDNPNIERKYTFAVEKGDEQQAVSNLLQYKQVKDADRVNAWCKN